MNKYINAGKLLSDLPDDLPYKASVKRVLIQAREADVVEVRQVNNFIQRLCNIPGAIYHSDLRQVCKEFEFDYPGRKMDEQRGE